MPYSYFELFQGFFIEHSTIGSTVHPRSLNRLEHCICTTTMTNIRPDRDSNLILPDYKPQSIRMSHRGRPVWHKAFAFTIRKLPNTLIAEKYDRWHYLEHTLCTSLLGKHCVKFQWNPLMTWGEIAFSVKLTVLTIGPCEHCIWILVKSCKLFERNSVWRSVTTMTSDIGPITGGPT